MSENIEALFKQISHGVYVIGVTDGTYQNAFTAAWVMQVSFNPLLLAISINPEHYNMPSLSILAIQTRIRWWGFNGISIRQVRLSYQKVWLILIVRSVIIAMPVIIRSPSVKLSQRLDLMRVVHCYIARLGIWMVVANYINKL
ncbi:MAG: hypothetical protein RIQ94_1916 [Pseudomonadota bacterium]